MGAAGLTTHSSDSLKRLLTGNVNLRNYDLIFTLLASILCFFIGEPPIFLSETARTLVVGISKQLLP